MAGTGLTHIGPYPLLSRLGAGGMGTVYLALHRGLGGFEKRLAVKCLNPHVAEDQQFVAMLVDEARLTAQLSHPNIVQVIDLASSEGLHYLVMEYVEGIDVRTLSAAGPLALDEAAQIIADAARGLAYAHRKTDAEGRPLHIVHRDISGHNLLASTAGATKVLDFGIAKAASNRHATEIGVLKGKLAYMSPEQALGKPLDGRSDLFSLGIVLWELCTGRRLFTGDTDLQLLMKVQRCEIERPSRLVPDFPPLLEAILMRCLAPSPDERYADGDALADELLTFARGCPAAEPVARRIGGKVAAYLAANPPAPLPGGSVAAGEPTLVGGSPSVEAETSLHVPGASRTVLVLGALVVIGALAGALWLWRPGLRIPALAHVPEGGKAVAAVQPVAGLRPAADAAAPPKSQPAAPPDSPIREVVRVVAPVGGRGAVAKTPPVKSPAAAVKEPPVSSEPVAPQPPSAATGDGFLSLNAVPWARVYIDGKPVAESTPLLRYALAPGVHKVVLVNPELRVRKEVEVEIAAGAERRASVQLR